jgi:DNA-directed RNA polymerase specialized sigma24 family protein
MLQKREDTEDNPQNVLLQTFRNINSRGQITLFSTWLVRVAINAVAVYAVGPDSPGDLYPGRQH